MTDAEFVQLYPNTSTQRMMELLGCSRSTVMKRARRLGVRKSPEHQSQQQAEKMTGRKRTAETRERIARKARGRIRSRESIEKASATRIQNGFNRGSNHYKWKGGQPWRRFAEPEYITWRNSVLARDHYRCQDCGRQCAKYERGLSAHHIKSYAGHPELRLDVANGVTLCRACHMARHGRPLAPKAKVPCACGCGQEIDAVDRYGHAGT
jgi:5-methylcytosine-specific restriction endonuclease McrA